MDAILGALLLDGITDQQHEMQGQVMADEVNERVASLSPRQREIVRLTSLGCPCHETAKILGMSRWTVENHQFQAKERLGIGKAAWLTRIAVQ